MLLLLILLLFLMIMCVVVVVVMDWDGLARWHLVRLVCVERVKSTTLEIDTDIRMDDVVNHLAE